MKNWSPRNIWHCDAAINLVRAFGWDWPSFDVAINRFRR
jgi:hypothetical protein